MDAQTLRQLIDADDVRPAWIQAHRGELSNLLDMHIPRAGIVDLDEWWSRNKSVVGRKVNGLLEEPDDVSDEYQDDEGSDDEEN